MTIELEIVTQERKVLTEEVDSVNLPGIMGRIGILPNHAPLLTVLDFGEVVIRKDGVESYYAIGGGIAEINPDKVIILADSADHAEEIDEQKAEEARQAAAKAMEATFGKKPIPTREGGSIPIVALFQEVLKLDTVLMGFGLNSDAIHNPNEHYGVFNYLKGIETIPLFHEHFAQMNPV